MKSFKIFLSLLLLFAIFILSSCSRYKDTITPIKLPSASSNGVTFGKGIKVVANIIQKDEDVGFNIKKSRVLPVRVTINNESPDTALIVASQCFLIDTDENAWPILEYDKAVQRIQDNVLIGDTVASAAKPSLLGGLLGAVGGLAIGILTDKNIAETSAKGAAAGAAAGAIFGGVSGYQDSGSKVSSDISEKEIKNKSILPNMITYGFLYFPAEASNIKEIRFAIETNGKLEVKKLSL